MYPRTHDVPHVVFVSGSAATGRRNAIPPHFTVNGRIVSGLHRHLNKLWFKDMVLSKLCHGASSQNVGSRVDDELMQMAAGLLAPCHVSNPRIKTWHPLTQSTWDAIKDGGYEIMTTQLPVCDSHAAGVATAVDIVLKRPSTKMAPGDLRRFFRSKRTKPAPIEVVIAELKTGHAHSPRDAPPCPFPLLDLKQTGIDKAHAQAAASAWMYTQTVPSTSYVVTDVVVIVSNDKGTTIVPCKTPDGMSPVEMGRLLVRGVPSKRGYIDNTLTVSSPPTTAGIDLLLKAATLPSPLKRRRKEKPDNATDEDPGTTPGPEE